MRLQDLSSRQPNWLAAVGASLVVGILAFADVPIGGWFFPWAIAPCIVVWGAIHGSPLARIVVTVAALGILGTVPYHRCSPDLPYGLAASMLALIYDLLPTRPGYLPTLQHSRLCFVALCLLVVCCTLVSWQVFVMPHAVCGAASTHASEWWAQLGITFLPGQLNVESGGPVKPRLLLGIYWAWLDFKILAFVVLLSSIPSLRLLTSLAPAGRRSSERRDSCIS